MLGNNIGNEMREKTCVVCEPKQRTIKDLVMNIKDKSTKADSMAEDIKANLFGSMTCDGKNENPDTCLEDVLCTIDVKLNSILNTLNIINNKL